MEEEEKKELINEELEDVNGGAVPGANLLKRVSENSQQMNAKIKKFHKIDLTVKH